jgi:hypothetical protein
MDVDRVPGVQQLVKLRHARRQFAPKFELVEIRDRNAAKNKTSSFRRLFGANHSAFVHIVIAC